MANITPSRNGEFLKVVFRILEENSDGVQAKDVLEYIEKNMDLTEFERGNYSSGGPRFEKIIRFATIPVVKAGWMIKEYGTWQITEEGRNANKKIVDPETFYREAYGIYRKWKSAQETLPVEEDQELEEA